LGEAWFFAELDVEGELGLVEALMVAAIPSVLNRGVGDSISGFSWDATGHETAEEASERNTKNDSQTKECKERVKY
jgi:hypothetical protein